MADLLRILRYALLVGSLLAAIFFGYVLSTERVPDSGRLVLSLMVAGFILNFVYILCCPPGQMRARSRLEK
jgi:flagellar biosynthesis protein FliR